MVMIIISKFHFFQVQKKLFLRYAMELGQTLFGVTPKSFQAVDIHFTAGKSLAMIHSQMTIPCQKSAGRNMGERRYRISNPQLPVKKSAMSALETCLSPK